MNPSPWLLLDLDGTLVDSSQGILSSLTYAMSCAGVTPAVRVDISLIGPPLPDMLRKVSGSEDAALLGLLGQHFRRHYDEEGYLETRPYPGIERALKQLAADSFDLHVVTNKRRLPALRILEMLNWSELFDSINTLDSTAGSRTKADVVAQMLAQTNYRRQAILVGDTLDDAKAAAANGLSFGWARWGYGSGLTTEPPDQTLAGCEDLIQFVKQGRH